MNRLYGLVGRDIHYSFSPSYFAEKFSREHIVNSKYLLFDLKNLSELMPLVQSLPDLKGLNITIPYKEEIISYLDKIDEQAAEVGAINTISISKKGKLIGYNTDIFGFEHSITPYLNKELKSALVLGTGGAAKAVAYVLKKLGIHYHFVSRSDQNALPYDELTSEIIKSHRLIINCTPLGTYPRIDLHPDLPFEAINENHIIYDLIYNPSATALMNKAALKGAIVKNGYEMLQLQAERSWAIWTEREY